jgi:hypothetical protein
MGCKDGFNHTGVIVKVAFFIVGISMFANWLAFTTNSWYRRDEATSQRYLGLWRTSLSSDIFFGNAGMEDGTGNTKFGVVQAFGIVGFMSQNVAFFLICIFMFRDKYRGNSEVRLASAILLFISASGWLISVAIFGAAIKDIGGSDYLHYSYAFAVIACGLGLIGGIFMAVGGSVHGHANVSAQ